MLVGFCDHMVVAESNKACSPNPLSSSRYTTRGVASAKAGKSETDSGDQISQVARSLAMILVANAPVGKTMLVNLNATLYKGSFPVESKPELFVLRSGKLFLV